jgi:3-hydroxyisobutyrate dehydrogenase-like beta-hydroxyacid dehydrogenase
VAPAHVGKLLRAIQEKLSAQFPLRPMNKDFGRILSLAETVTARVPATEVAFEINAKRLQERKRRGFLGGHSEKDGPNQILLRTRPS